MNKSKESYPSRNHHLRSALWWWRSSTSIDLSINLLWKILPAGTTLQANDSFPMWDSIQRLVHIWHFTICCNSCRISSFLSSDMIVVQCQGMKFLLGPMTLDGFTAASSDSHKVSIFCWLCLPMC